jgi:hypothetical protein
LNDYRKYLKENKVKKLIKMWYNFIGEWYE